MITHRVSSAGPRSATLQQAFDSLLREAAFKSLSSATITCYSNHWRIVTRVVPERNHPTKSTSAPC